MKGESVVVFSDTYPQWNGERGIVLETGMMQVDGAQMAGARVKMTGFRTAPMVVDWPITDLRKA